MKFLELISVLEKVITELISQYPEVRFILIASDAGRTCFRNTTMTDNECVEQCSQALMLAALGKGVFVKSKKAEQ
jgi:hypothetical protein